MTEQKYSFLENVGSELDKCTKCASCQAGCPTYELSDSETLVARGKIRLAQGTLSGKTPLSDRIINDFSQCLSCMNCKTACPSGVDTMAIFSAMRSEIYNKQGAGPIAEFIFKYFLPYPWRLNLLAKVVGLSSIFYKMAPRAFAAFFPFSPGGVKRVTPDFLKRNLRSLIKEVNKAKGDKSAAPLKKVIFFSGCMTDLAFSGVGKKVVEGLNAAGVEVIFPSEQLCCGAPSYYTGDMETTRQLARKNIDLLDAIDADAIVYSCATCGSTLGESYPKLFPGDEKAARVAAKMVDYQKLLVELSIEKLLEGESGARKIKVTYHDPCHLKRGMGVSKEPRQLLKSLPSVEFVEMDGADSCCGGSGTFSLKYYDMAMEQGRRKVDWIRKSGADVVVTACPSCQLQLADALHRHGEKTPVMHTADLVAMALQSSVK